MHVDGMCNINRQEFGKAQAIVIFPCRIFRRYTVGREKENERRGRELETCLPVSVGIHPQESREWPRSQTERGHPLRYQKLQAWSTVGESVSVCVCVCVCV